MKTRTAPLEDLFPKRLLLPHYWLMWGVLLLLRLLVRLPYSLIVAAGNVLGEVFFFLPTRFVRIARRNIELCLPELDSREQRVLLRKHFRSLGIAVLEVAVAWWLCPARWNRLVHVEGAEHLEAALRRGKGVILLAAHFTTLEVGGRALLSVAPASFLYKPSKNRLLAHLMKSQRCKYGGHAVSRDNIRAVVAALRRNECVWYAPDQSYRGKSAQMVDFFRVPAASNVVTSRLAQITGAVVLPYFCHRLPGAGGYQAVIHPPWEGFPGSCPIADMGRFHALIEDEVKRVPEQYLWIHRRFKSIVPHARNLYENL